MDNNGTVSWQAHRFDLPYKGGQQPNIPKYVPWQFGMQQKIQGKSMIMHKPQMNGGTYNVGVLGTPQMTGGTYNLPTLVNSNNQVTFNSNGLVSTENFTHNQVLGNPAQTTASTSYVDVTGSSFTIAVANQAIYTLFNVTTAIGMTDFVPAADGNQCEAILYDDYLVGAAIATLASPGVGNTTFVSGAINNTDLNLVINFGASSYSYNNPHSHGLSWKESLASAWVTFSAILQLGVGTHNYKLQFRANSAGTAICNSFIVNYLTLGF